MQVRKSTFRIVTLVGLTAAMLGIGGVLWWQNNTPHAIYARGRQALQRGDWATVEHAARSLASRPDWKARTALLNGYLAKSRGNNDLALVLFSDANQSPETHEESYYEAALICYQQKQFSQAILLLRQVLEWNADDVTAWRLLASAWYDIGAMERAIQCLESVIRLAPTDYRPHYMKATILKDFERFEDASLAFQTATSLAPVNSAVHDEIRAGWGDCLIRLRRYRESLDVMQPARDWPDILAQRALAFFSLRRFDEAAQMADQALAAQSLHPEALLVAASSLERTGRSEDGLALLREGIAAHPMELRMYHRMADLLSTAGQTDEAVTFRTRAGQIAELRAQFSAAHQALVQDTSSVEKRLTLATLAEQLNETEMAEDWYYAAVCMDPNHPQARQALQAFLQKHPERLSTTSHRGNSAKTSASPSDDPPADVEF